MPVLPSRRIVSIDFEPLHELALQAEAEQIASNLLFIEKDEQIFSLIRVKEVEWRPDIPSEELDIVETPRGLKSCILLDTGYSVSDVLAARVPWSRGDISALRQFILTPRIRQKVRFYQRWLTALRGKFTERAIMWPSAGNLLPHKADPKTEKLANGGF